MIVAMSRKICLERNWKEMAVFILNSTCRTWTMPAGAALASSTSWLLSALGDLLLAPCWLQQA